MVPAEVSHRGHFSPSSSPVVLCAYYSQLDFSWRWGTFTFLVSFRQVCVPEPLKLGFFSIPDPFLGVLQQRCFTFPAVIADLFFEECSILGSRRRRFASTSVSAWWVSGCVLRRIGSPISFPEADRFYFYLRSNVASLVVLNSSKESSCQCRRYRSNPWVQNTHWGRKLQPTPVFLPAKSHEQRCLAGYSPWGCKESDMTKRLNNNNSIASLLFPKRREFISLPWQMKPFVL